MSHTGGAAFPVPSNVRIDELIDIYDNIIDDVDRSLAERAISDRLPIPALPTGLEGHIEFAENGDPIVPADVTELDLVTLGKLFGYASGWTNYLSAEYMRSKAMHLVQSRTVRVLQSALKIYYKEDCGIAAAMLDAKIDMDERFVSADAGLLRMEVYMRKTQERFEQMKRSLNLISREQTRKAQDVENQDRQERTAPVVNPQRWRRPR